MDLTFVPDLAMVPIPVSRMERILFSLSGMMRIEELVDDGVNTCKHMSLTQHGLIETATFSNFSLFTNFHSLAQQHSGNYKIFEMLYPNSLDFF